jgi:thiol-disulfide isomerase/thioredoxin
MKRFFLFLWLVFAACYAAGCHSRQSLPEQGDWDGTVELAGLKDGKILPVRMHLDLASTKPSGYFLVGDDKTPIPEISRSGDSIVLGFSEYSADVRASWDGSRLTGTYNRIRSDGTKSLKFVAAPAGSSAVPPLPFESSPKTPLPDGNYQVLFQDEDNKVDDTTVAKLWSKDGILSGTFIAPDGDYGLLSGRPTAKGFQLSRFTGWQAIAIDIEFDRGVWGGTFYAASNDKPRQFGLQPRRDLDIGPETSKQTVMRNPSAMFSFSGLSLSGETVRDTDDRFKGKALIVDIMGTWCHNCLDEAPILEQLQKQYGKDGFEIVGLSFEISDDPALAKKNLQLYKDRFGLTYTLLFCGSLDDANVMKQIHSQLDNFFAYPTAIFIDKNRKVQSIHSGFKGPGTGDQFQAQIQEFQGLTQKLMQ